MTSERSVAIGNSSQLPVARAQQRMKRMIKQADKGVESLSDV